MALKDAIQVAQNGGEVAVPKEQTISQIVGKKLASPSSERFLSVALEGTGINPEKFRANALVAVRNSAAIHKCAPESIVSCLIQAAQIGLEVIPTLKMCYLIPYKGECSLNISYIGLLELARRSGLYESIYAYPVYEGDEFEYELGLDIKLTHKPAIRARSDKEKPLFVYAVAKLKDGGVRLEVMSYQEVEAIRAKGAQDSKAWSDFYAEMAKKTVLRRLLKTLPTSVGFAKAAEIEEARDMGKIIKSNVTDDGEVIDVVEEV